MSTIYPLPQPKAMLSAPIIRCYDLRKDQAGKPMNTQKARIKWSDFTSAFVLMAISFGIAALFIYMAYVGMETGTVLKTKPYPRSVPHGRGEQQYAGVYSRNENPRQFWLAETLYVAAAVFSLIAGVQPIRQEYKEQMDRQKSASVPHHVKNEKQSA